MLNYNYGLFECDVLGNHKIIKKFYTLEEMFYYIELKHIEFNKCLLEKYNIPIYKYRVYSYRLKQFI